MTPKLSSRAVVMITVLVQYGIVSFSLSRLLAENVGTNGWAILPVFGAVAALNIWLFSIVYKKGGGRSIFAIAEKALPKFVLLPLLLLLSNFWQGLGCVIGKEFVLILISLSYPNVNPVFLYLLFSILVFLLMTKGIRGIANAGVVFFCMSITMAFIFPILWKDFRISRLTPFWFQDASISFEGLSGIYLAFVGYELCLVLFPYANKQTRLIRSAQIGNAITTYLYVFFALVSFGFFSFKQLSELAYPNLNLLSFLQFPIVQRVDSFLFNLTMLRALFINVMYLWAGTEALKPIAKKKFRRTAYLSSAYTILFTAWVVPSDLDRIRQWLSYAGYMEATLALVLPFILLALIGIGNKKEQSYA